MSYSPDVALAANAFHDGYTHDAGRYVIEVHSCGLLELPSGQLVACDPFTKLFDTPGFVTEVAPGAYPAEVSVAHFEESGERRIAFARVVLDRRPVARWSLALIPGDDPATLDAYGYFGYHVEAGAGCFADALACSRLQNKAAFKAFEDELSNALDRANQLTWNWANLVLDQDSGLNVVAFHSGWGDGHYPTFFGYSGGAGEPVEVLTDFQVLKQ